jgi:hypothetical protein
MRVRLLAILVLVLLFSFGLVGAPAAIQGRPSLSLAECSPPAGLQLPVGQGVVVRCRLQGGAQVIHVEFWVNQESQYTVEVEADEAASWTWVPTQTGPHMLTVVASADVHQAAAISRQVMVVPGETPVRIP